MIQSTATYSEYEVLVNKKVLKLTGRSWVQSDKDIISMVFEKKMFATDAMSQHASLVDYYNYLLANTLRPVLIDAGANIGTASAYFGHVYPELKIVAIEPDIENVSLLTRNSVSLDIDVISGAVSNTDGTLYLNNIDFGPIAYRVGEVGNIEVKCVSMETVLAKLASNERPFLVKIDIEGGEDYLFSSNTGWMNHIPLIIIELHDWMLPFTGVSRNFYKALSVLDFDVINSGENTFCFNRSLLEKFWGKEHS